jgi:hypothetical protein
VGVLLSGYGTAQSWHWVSWTDSVYCTNEDNIDGADDGNDAQIGQNLPFKTCGAILLDLGSGNEMSPNQEFTVFADSSFNETYDVSVSEDGNFLTSTEVGEGWDTEDIEFSCPPDFGKNWRYIHINGTYGGSVVGDLPYGPDIDAVGWYG